MLHPRQGAIYHWNQKFDEIIPVVKAWWGDGGDCDVYTWGTNAAKMTITECDGKFYICYSQFGSKQFPCGQYSNFNGIISGRLYVTCYDEVYQAWDRPQPRSHRCCPGRPARARRQWGRPR